MFKYINLGNQLHYKKYNQKLHHVEYYDGKWKQFLLIFWSLFGDYVHSIKIFFIKILVKIVKIVCYIAMTTYIYKSIKIKS